MILFKKNHIKFVFYIISDLFLFSGFIGICMAFTDKKDKLGAMIYDQLTPIVSFMIKIFRLMGFDISLGNFNTQYLSFFGLLFLTGMAGNYFFLIKKR